MRTQCSGGQWAHKKSDKHHISSALIEVFSRPHGVIIEEENLKRNVLFDTICLYAADGDHTSDVGTSVCRASSCIKRRQWILKQALHVNSKHCDRAWTVSVPGDQATCWHLTREGTWQYFGTLNGRSGGRDINETRESSLFQHGANLCVIVHVMSCWYVILWANDSVNKWLVSGLNA